MLRYYSIISLTMGVVVQEINLYDLLRHYAKYWLLILLLTLTGLIAGFVYNNYIQIPKYKSNATLLVQNDENLGSDAKSTIINNYLELFKSRRVLEPVIDELDLDKTYEELINSVSTRNNKDTEVVDLTIISENPQQSKDIVDATVISFRNELKRLYEIDRIKLIDSANLPADAYNVRETIQLVLFAIAGFLLSLIIVFFIYDYRLNYPNKVTETNTANIKSLEPATTKQKGNKVSAVIARKKAKRKIKKQARLESRIAKKQAKKEAKAAKKHKDKTGEVVTAKRERDPSTGRFVSKNAKSHKKNKG
jgi:capsular polysaccharide biosynthesis protein